MKKTIPQMTKCKNCLGVIYTNENDTYDYVLFNDMGFCFQDLQDIKNSGDKEYLEVVKIPLKNDKYVFVEFAHLFNGNNEGFVKCYNELLELSKETR